MTQNPYHVKRPPDAAEATWKKYAASKDTRYLNEQLAYDKEDVVMLWRIEEALARF